MCNNYSELLHTSLRVRVGDMKLTLLSIPFGGTTGSGGGGGSSTIPVKDMTSNSLQKHSSSKCSWCNNVWQICLNDENLVMEISEFSKR